MGVLHGIAGGAHVIGILPALALPSLAASAAYVGGFAAGTVASMGVFALVLGRMSDRAGQRSEGAFRSMLGVSGAATMAMGWIWVSRA